MKFSEEKVELCLYKADEKVITEVRDRGLGIKEDELKRALQVFEQINREEYEQQGGGLGLAIAAKYAEINKAELTLSLREGGGTTARIVLQEDRSQSK